MSMSASGPMDSSIGQNEPHAILVGGYLANFAVWWLKFAIWWLIKFAIWWPTNYMHFYVAHGAARAINTFRWFLQMVGLATMASKDGSLMAVAW